MNNSSYTPLNVFAQPHHEIASGCLVLADGSRYGRKITDYAQKENKPIKCGECGYFRGFFKVCDIGFKTTYNCKPCRQAISIADMAKRGE